MRDGYDDIDSQRLSREGTLQGEGMAWAEAKSQTSAVQGAWSRRKGDQNPGRRGRGEQAMEILNTTVRNLDIIQKAIASSREREWPEQFWNLESLLWQGYYRFEPMETEGNGGSDHKPQAWKKDVN